MIHTRIRTAQGEYRNDAPLEELHALVEDQSNLIWLDLESPSSEDLGLVAGLLNWEHLTVEDLTRQGQRAKLEQAEGYTLLVMHALTYQGEPPKLTAPEVDFVIGKNYVVSVHYFPLLHVTEARELAQHTEAILGNGSDFLL